MVEFKGRSVTLRIEPRTVASGAQCPTLQRRRARRLGGCGLQAVLGKAGSGDNVAGTAEDRAGDGGPDPTG